MADVMQLANGTQTVIIQSDPSTFGVYVATAILAAATIVLVFLTWRSLVATNRQTRESNRLTMEALRLKQTELDSIIGKPNIEPVNIAAEPQLVDGYLLYHPHFKNDGQVEATNIKIGYYVFDSVIDTLLELIAFEHDIKDNNFSVPGSVFKQSRRVDDLSIKWKPRDSLHSVVLWFTYEYLQNQHDQVIYNLHFKGGGKAHKVIPYRSLDIEQARNLT